VGNLDTREHPPPGCSFCHKIVGCQSESDYDQPLAASADALLVPALGMFTPGYLLLVTRLHFRSFAYLEAEQLRRTAHWLEELVEQLADEFGGYFVFEHGMGDSPLLPVGACVEHAHLHLIPATSAVSSIRQALLWREIAGFDELADWRGQPYSYLFVKGRHLISPNPSLPGQWVRRITASALGVDTWDWAIYRGDLELADTLQRLPTLAPTTSILSLEKRLRC
jgi:diadenosine tetraphosphate (Ap4A) HIT family hydrolase